MMMTVEEGLEFIEQVLELHRLTMIQKLIFARSWEGKGYKDIAKETGHTPDHIKNIGSELWKSLSEALGEKVTKHNFATILQRYRRRQYCLCSCHCDPAIDSAMVSQQHQWHNAGIGYLFGSLHHGFATPLILPVIAGSEPGQSHTSQQQIG
jgi:hypothetical protein